ncbi:MAG: hypothetical protein IIX40_07750, partial [Alistipes sp.]|nr:hypothetical protein [Alistipes sp.]
MKRFFVAIIALSLSVVAMAAEPRHRDPNVNSVNREPMRSSFIVYPSAAEVQSGLKVKNLQVPSITINQAEIKKYTECASLMQTKIALLKLDENFKTKMWA